MKKKGLTLTLIAFMAFILVACSNSKPIKPDTPDNTLLLLSTAISGNNYDSFEELFSDERKNTVSKETLSQYSKVTTAGFDNSLYGLITYSNGEMFIAKLSAKKINGEYKVEDLMKVPEEMKKLFQGK